MTTKEFGYTVSIDLEKQKVFLEPAGTGTRLRQSREIYDALQTAGITIGIDDRAIQMAFAASANRPILIASAIPPLEGEVGSLQFSIPICCEESPEKAAHFEICRSGQILGRILPPTIGPAGRTLTGEEIPGLPGAPCPIQLGPGIEQRENGDLVSQYDGRPLYNGQTLSIEPMLILQKDLGPKDPPIDFDGHVIIYGEIQDGARISARSIDAHGLIGAAEIQCEGAFFARKAIKAHGKGYIFINGDAILQDAIAAILTIHGHLQAQKIQNCELSCLGRITAQQISGGRCTALLGIVVTDLGTDLSQTILEPGIHYELRDLLAQIQDVTERIATALQPIEPFLDAPSAMNTLTEHSRENLRNRGSLFLELTQKRAHLVQRRNQIMESASSSIANVVVHHQRHGKLLINTPNAQLTLSSKREGALLIAGDGERLIETTHLTGPLMTPPSQLLKS